MVKRKSKMDWKIWAKNGLFHIVLLLLAGALVVWADQPWFLAVHPVVDRSLNWWKHQGKALLLKK